MLDGKIKARTLPQGEQHGEADCRPYPEIDQGSRTKQRLQRRVRRGPGLFGRNIVQRQIVDQTAWTAYLFHHLVAGINAQGAGDAADLRTFADIDTGRANGHALVAIDAIADRLIRSGCPAPQRGQWCGTPAIAFKDGDGHAWICRVDD